MKIRKRYIVLILLGFLPLLELIHPNNYCFGDTNLFIIGIYVAIFAMAFITILFYNLYKISERKELFNYRPILIAAVYAVILFVFLHFHDQSFFKNEVLFFKIEGRTNPTSEITLFFDKSFEYKTTSSKNSCFIKGTYQFKKDTLFLKKNQSVEVNNQLDSIYLFDKKLGKLISKNKNYGDFNLKK